MALVRATRALASGGSGRDERGEVAFLRRLAARLSRPVPGEQGACLAAGVDFVTPSLVQEILPDVMRHRIGLTYEAEPRS